MTLPASDRLDILELLARADAAATRRDVDTYVGLFTDDAVLDGEKGQQSGKDALRLTVGRVWQAGGPETVHVTLNAVIDPSGVSPDRAVATSTLLILKKGSGFSIDSVWTIVQHVVRVQGRWLIERRTIAGASAAG